MAFTLRTAIGPLLVLKHFSPLLKAGATDQRTEDSDVPGARAVFYSARVGSIGDNATGPLAEKCFNCSRLGSLTMTMTMYFHVFLLLDEVAGTLTGAARQH